MGEETFTLAAAHQEFAKRTNGEVWELLGKDQRSEDEDRRMLMAAYTSLYHWIQVGTEAHMQRGEWMIAHVYTVLGEAKPAIRHAKRCLDLTNGYKDQMADFDIAYAHEGLARSYALAGDLQVAKNYLDLATAAGEAIADAESKEIFMADFEGGNWYGIR